LYWTDECIVAFWVDHRVVKVHKPLSNYIWTSSPLFLYFPSYFWKTVCLKRWNMHWTKGSYLFINNRIPLAWMMLPPRQNGQIKAIISSRASSFPLSQLSSILDPLFPITLILVRASIILGTCEYKHIDRSRDLEMAKSEVEVEVSELTGLESLALVFYLVFRNSYCYSWYEVERRFE